MMKMRIDGKGAQWYRKYRAGNPEAMPENYRSNPISKNQTQKRKKPTKAEKELQELHEEAQKAALMEPILKVKKLEFETERKENDLRKQAGELIEFSLAEYLFFGYMEKANNEILRLVKKLKPIIINLVNEQEPEELLKRLQRELETILVDLKDQQKRDLMNWRADD